MDLMLVYLVGHICSIIYPLHICFDVFHSIFKTFQKSVKVKERWKRAITKAAAQNGKRGRTRSEEAEWEPDLCIQLLKIPAAHNYAAIRKMMEKAPRKWILQFLECDGLEVLLESLEKLGTKGFSSLADTFSQLQCVGCLRAVMNSQCGLEFIIKRRDYTRQLANDELKVNICGMKSTLYASNKYLYEPVSLFLKTFVFSEHLSISYLQSILSDICYVLQSQDRVVKLQVFELLCALSMYSEEGHVLALDALNHFKICHGRRYRFDLIISELRSADTNTYRTTLMAFINCLIFGYVQILKRTRLRSEFYGVGLGSVLDDLRKSDNEDLQIQITAFDEQQRKDEEETEPLTHQHLFDLLFKKIANTPQALAFHTVLLNLSQMEAYNSDIDRMWELLEEITSNMARNNKFEKQTLSKRSCMRETSTQTVGGGKRWAGLRRINNSSIGIQVDTKDNIFYKTDSNSSLCNTLSSLSIPSSSSFSLSEDNLLSSNTEDTETNSISSSESKIHIPEIPVPPPLPDCELIVIHPPVLQPVPEQVFNTIDSIPTPPPLPIQKANIPVPPPLPDASPILQPIPQAPSLPPPPPPPMPELFIPETPPPPPAPPLPHLLVNNSSSSSNLDKLTDNPQPSTSAPPPPPPPPAQTSQDELLPIFKNYLWPPSLPLSTSPQSPDTNNTTQDLINNEKLTSTPTGHMTLPSRRITPLATELVQNKYNTLPHPSKKMKTLNWTKVPSQVIEKSLWSNTEMPNALPVDYDKMEELFCQKPKAKVGSPYSMRLGASPKPVTQTINLLENKRSLAVNIFLKQFKSGSTCVINSLMTGSGLSAEKLKALKRLLPEKGELSVIEAHKSDGVLGVAEKFFQQLSEITNYELRVEAMLQKEECPACIADISPQLDKILEGCNFLIENSNLKQFLKIVLHLGNYLNAGSYAGNAVGFKLNTLPKLLETRANKPRVTFLHFVVDVAQSYDEHILDFKKQGANLRELTRTPLSNIEEEVKLLSNNIKELTKKLKKAGEKDVYSQFSDFIDTADNCIAELKRKVSHVKEVSSQLAIHFCEDPETFKLDECFSLFADFFEKLSTVIKDNEQRKRQEEISAKTTEKKYKTQIRRRKSRLTEDKDCVVDMLMKEIRSGTFKLRKTPNH